MKTLRKHQIEASDACIIQFKGSVNLPTGTGKTTIEIDIIRRLILEEQAKKKYAGVYVVVSPRILLSFQHLSNLISELSSEKIKASYLNVNSGRYYSADAEKEMAKCGLQASAVPSTTDFREIQKEYNRCFASGEPLILSSTYDSVYRIQMAGIPVTCYIYDEAHCMVDAGNYNESAHYTSDRKYFFTATPKTTDSKDGRGDAKCRPFWNLYL